MPIIPPEGRAAAPDFHLPVILLADDDADDRNFFGEAVSIIREPARLVMVKDGEELMEYLHVSPLPDLLFLDLNMPRKNGAQCLTEIKGNHLLAALPVVILSTTTNEAKQNQLAEEGARFFFSKPAEFSALVNLLQKTIQLILYNSHQPAAPLNHEITST
jgi:CheY-like chemotaxis protein